MRKVCVENITPGMVLGENLVGMDGAVVAQKGEVIEDEYLDVMDDIGLDAIKVDIDDAESDELLLEWVEGYVRKFFTYVDPDNEAFEEVFRHVMVRTYNAVEAGWELPCDYELTAQSFEHLRDLFFKGQGKPEDIVKHETELASFPDVYFKIKEVMDSPTSSATDVAQVVANDISLSAKLLKVVNSPFYGFATSIDSVEHAVSLIGMEELGTLALGISTISYFKDIPPELMDMRMFWKHSLSCAIFSKLIGGHIAGNRGERYFTAGLLHDVGRLILFKNMPYGSTQALLFARENMVPLVEAESVVFEYDHSTVADILLNAWQFPSELTDMITHHHSPMGSAEPKDAAIIQLADNLANAVAINDGGMYVLPGMDERVWRALELDSELIGKFIASFDESIDDIMKVFVG